MRIFKKNINTVQLQVIIWILVAFLSYLSNLQYGSASNALNFTVLEMLFYAVIIFGNTYWLIPRFYAERKIVTYIVLLVLLLTFAVISGALGTVYLDNLGAPIKTGMTIKILAYHIFSAVLIFIFSVLYRLALDYFVLSKTQDQIKAEKAQTELHLLKQQVHPHFLFNTLNNIYYVAQKGSPEAAELIERLSDIMRYFVEESKKEKVLLKDELELLKSYIELESIRMRYEMPIDFEIQGEIDAVIIPPLLLLPIVENIFKHGIDKRSKQNFAKISLTVQDKQLLFRTENRYYSPELKEQGSRTGMVNLDKRLKLYYGNKYELGTRKQGDLFIVNLLINNHEN